MPETARAVGNATPAQAETATKVSRTSWSVIVRAQGEGRDAQRALGELIKRYQSTVAMMLRAHRAPWNSTVEDLSQDFFLGFISRNDVAKLDPSRGRFRDWLRVATRNFMAKHWQAWLAEKRGNLITAPAEFQILHHSTPELLFMRQFAEDTLEKALERLRAERRDPARFDKLVRFLRPIELPDVRPLAEAWGIPPNRLSVELHALRERHELVLRELVADTLDVDPTDPKGKQAIALELQALYRALCDVPRHRVVLEDA